MPGEVVLRGGIVVRRLVLEGFGELEQWWDTWVVAMEAGSGEGTTHWCQGWPGLVWVPRSERGWEEHWSARATVPSAGSGGRKQQKLIFSHFRRLEAQEQSVSRAAFLSGLSCGLGGGCPLPVSSHGCFSVCICLNPFL